jgi:hypothetical protein
MTCATISSPSLKSPTGGSALISRGAQLPSAGTVTPPIELSAPPTNHTISRLRGESAIEEPQQQTYFHIVSLSSPPMYTEVVNTVAKSGLKVLE